MVIEIAYISRHDLPGVAMLFSSETELGKKLYECMWLTSLFIC